MELRLKYVWEDVDRHGNVRVYVKVPGRTKVRIRERPGTPEFIAAYNAAMDGASASPKIKDSRRGSFGYVCKAYYASKVFQRLDLGTQAWRRRELDKICEKHADKPIAAMKPEHIRLLRDEKKTPDASNQRLKALRALFNWAVEAGEAPHNPVIEVKRIPPPNTGGHKPWTPEIVRKFEERHPVGSRARLAMALMLYTTGRREDATRFGPQHVRARIEIVDGQEIAIKRIIYTQAKNEHRNPVHLDIPMHPELEKIINATPSGHLTFLVTALGKPFTPAGFGNWFRDQCDAAGLSEFSAHGLRKALPAILAESGATAHEIQSWTGHLTLSEVQRYTRSARQKILADSAMQKLIANKNPPTPLASGRKSPKSA